MAKGLLWLGLLLLGLGGTGLRGGPGPAASFPATPPTTPTAASPVRITLPGYGAVLQGTVIVHAQPRAPHATQVALELGYGPEGPWFPLARWAPPPPAGPLWAWDTTTIADGAYWLRLVVLLDDGSRLTHAIPVQVRNHTPAQATPTLPAGVPPTPTPRPATPTATPWPTLAPRPQPPANPAALSWAQWRSVAQAAAGLAAAAAVLFSLLAARRRAP